MSEGDVRADRKAHGIVATFKSVDTCTAEFEAYTPYYYSTYEDEDETPAKRRGTKRIMVLGGGPNRIGQGIEFDYDCISTPSAVLIGADGLIRSELATGGPAIKQLMTSAANHLSTR